MIISFIPLDWNAMYKVTIALKRTAPPDAVQFFSNAADTYFRAAENCSISRWKAEQSLVGDTEIAEMLEFQFSDKDHADSYFSDRSLIPFHRAAAAWYEVLEVRYLSPLSEK